MQTEIALHILYVQTSHATMLTHRGFSAWITSDNMELVEFEPRTDEKANKVICWIAGPIGKVGLPVA